MFPLHLFVAIYKMLKNPDTAREVGHRWIKNECFSGSLFLVKPTSSLPIRPGT